MARLEKTLTMIYRILYGTIGLSLKQRIHSTFFVFLLVPKTGTVQSSHNEHLQWKKSTTRFRDYSLPRRQEEIYSGPAGGLVLLASERAASRRIYYPLSYSRAREQWSDNYE